MRARIKNQVILFDWGGTVMRNFPAFSGPMRAWPEVEELPGVRAALQSLSRFFGIALATNAEDSDEIGIRKALDRCDLSGLFDLVFCFRRIGHRKPDPAFYEAVVESLAIDPTKIFMVGDSFEGDVLAANAAGIPAVWFNPGSDDSRSGPHHRTIHRFEDLGAALEELGAKVSRS